MHICDLPTDILGFISQFCDIDTRFAWQKAGMPAPSRRLPSTSHLCLGSMPAWNGRLQISASKGYHIMHLPSNTRFRIIALVQIEIPHHIDHRVMDAGWYVGWKTTW